MSFTKNTWTLLICVVGYAAMLLPCSCSGQGIEDLQQLQEQGAQEAQQADTSTSTDNTTGGGGTASGGDGQIDTSASIVGIEISDNLRNQGFVGATAPGISSDSETGFVGAASEQSGPPLAEGASYGGGVNDVSPTIPGGANGENNSFTVVRKSIRARLRPSFYAPKTANEVVSSRFQNHFSRQPGSQTSGSGYNITVSNRTAYITGWVNTAADSQRLERQLRLEPGVYQIVNQLSVVGPQQPIDYIDYIE